MVEENELNHDYMSVRMPSQHVHPQGKIDARRWLRPRCPEMARREAEGCLVGLFDRRARESVSKEPEDAPQRKERADLTFSEK